MKINLIARRAATDIASVSDGILLPNPYRPTGNEISNSEPARGCDVSQDCSQTSHRVLRVVGYKEMTAANCNRFRKAACAAWNEHTVVEVDLSETTFIDCAGLGALIAVRNLTRERKGVARLINPTSPVQLMLDLTGTGQLFDIINTAAAGVVLGPSAHN